MDDEPITKIERRDGVVVLTLLGEHDIASAPAVRAELDGLARGDEAVVVDASETAFVDSTILHVLLEADEQLCRRGRRLVLQLADGSRIQRTIALAGLDELLPVSKSRTDAVRLARSNAANVS